MPRCFSGKQLIKFLIKKDFTIYSQKGSHVKLISQKRKTKTIIPLHRVIAKGTLNDILAQAKLTEAETWELFNS